MIEPLNRQNLQVVPGNRKSKIAFPHIVERRNPGRDVIRVDSEVGSFVSSRTGRNLFNKNLFNHHLMPDGIDRAFESPKFLGLYPVTEKQNLYFHTQVNKGIPEGM